MAVFKAPRKSG